MIVTFLGHSRFLKSEEYERKMLELLEETANEQSAELYLGAMEILINLHTNVV